MKKLLCLFAVIALAAPVYAADPNVVITCIDLRTAQPPQPGYCEVRYEVKTQDGVDPGLVRGFAMDITVSGNTTITGISGYSADGTPTSTPSKYGVFISSINFGSDPNNVDAWGDPVVASSEPGALGGLGTNGITVEVASLYNKTTEPGKAPLKTGTLFKLQLAPNLDASTNVTITAEPLRGGLVMEDVKKANLISTGCTVTFDCFPQGGVGGIAAYNDWVSFGKPDCWCWTRQCHGDANNGKEGSTATGWFYVGTGDLTILSSGWKVKEPPKGSGILSIPNGICAIERN